MSQAVAAIAGDFQVDYWMSLSVEGRLFVVQPRHCKASSQIVMIDIQINIVAQPWPTYQHLILPFPRTQTYKHANQHLERQPIFEPNRQPIHEPNCRLELMQESQIVAE